MNFNNNPLVFKKYIIKLTCTNIITYCIPYCLFPGRIVTWAWSLAKGQYMVSWLLTGAPEQRYWQNRETANVGLDSSVGRAPARQSGGRRFKSRSSQFSLFILIYLKSVPSQFPLWFIMNFNNNPLVFKKYIIKLTCTNIITVGGSVFVKTTKNNILLLSCSMTFLNG